MRLHTLQSLGGQWKGKSSAVRLVKTPEHINRVEDKSKPW